MHTLLPLLLAVTAGAPKASHREQRVLVVDDTPRSYEVRVAPHGAVGFQKYWTPAFAETFPPGSASGVTRFTCLASPPFVHPPSARA